MLGSRFNDITIRNILNIKDYLLIPYSEIYKKENCNKSFFYMDNYKICIGFKIDTIDGKITIPVIGMKNIRLRRRIKYDLQKYHIQLNKKKKLKSYLILLNYTNLPIELIDKIISYY